MLTRKQLTQPQELDWFSFSAPLVIRVSSDYIAMRLLHQLEPLTCAPTICVMMLEVVEKALKLHLAVHTQTRTALADMGSKFGHNLEALRASCVAYTPAFADPDVCAFTRDLNDRDGKLYQELRYGAQKMTEGFSTNLSTLRPVVDKIFCESLLGLPEEIRRLLWYPSPLIQLLLRTTFDQSRHPSELVDALSRDNAYFGPLLEFAHRVDGERAALVGKQRLDQPNAPDA